MFSLIWESKKGKFIETESITIVARDWWVEERGRWWSKTTNINLKWELNEINLAQYLAHNKPLLNVSYYLIIVNK